MPITFNRLPAISAKARPTVGAALGRAAFSVEAYAKADAPVDSGNLRASIAAGQAGVLTWHITAHADYALYVEMGTHKMSAQPYLEPALRRGVKQLDGVLGAIL